MDTKLIFIISLLSTSVYAMDLRSKFPEYEDNFDDYEKRAQQLPPPKVVSGGINRSSENNAPVTGTIERTPQVSPNEGSKIPPPPQKKIITEADIKIPKFYKFLPKSYRQKLINKRIKKAQDIEDKRYAEEMEAYVKEHSQVRD